MSPCDEFVRCTFSNAAVSVLRFRHPRPAGHWGCNGSTHLWVQFAWQVASVAPFLLVFLFWKHGILHSAASLVGSFLFFHWFALLLDLRGLLQWPGKDYGDVQLPGRSLETERPPTLRVDVLGPWGPMMAKPLRSMWQPWTKDFKRLTWFRKWLPSKRSMAHFCRKPGMVCCQVWRCQCRPYAGKEWTVAYLKWKQFAWWSEVSIALTFVTFALRPSELHPRLALCTLNVRLLVQALQLVHRGTDP